MRLDMRENKNRVLLLESTLLNETSFKTTHQKSRVFFWDGKDGTPESQCERK